MKNIYVIDFGNKSATIYDKSKDEVQSISFVDVLSLPEKLPNGSLVISENAHLGSPRTKKSKAQVFTAEQLLDLYDRFKNNNIELKLFSQKLTPNACSFAKLKKSNTNDPISIAMYLDYHPNLTLKNPPKSFVDLKREASYQYKQDTTTYCNFARAEPAYKDDECSKWIMNNIEEIASRLDDETKYWFGLTDDSRYIGGPKHLRGTFKIKAISMNGIFAVVSTILDIDGRKRVRPETNKMPGWGYIKKYVIQMSPFHEHGGTARSNLYWHVFKAKLNQRAKPLGLNYARKVHKLDSDEETITIHRGDFTNEENIFFIQERKKFSDSIRQLWQTCRDLLNSDPNIQKQDSRSFSEESEIKALSCIN